MSEIKFGERIREVRKNTGCNQKEFCAALGIPQSTLSAYETNRMQPTISTLMKIAEKFNVSLDWLCGIERKAVREVDSSSGSLSDDKVLSELQAVVDYCKKILKEIQQQHGVYNEIEKRRAQ